MASGKQVGNNRRIQFGQRVNRTIGSSGEKRLSRISGGYGDTTHPCRSRRFYAGYRILDHYTIPWRYT